MSVDGTVVCPHCGETSRVARKYAGRRARCHRCSKNFAITFLRSGETPPTPPPAAATGGRSFGRSLWVLAVAAIVLGGAGIGIALNRSRTAPPVAVAAPAPETPRAVEDRRPAAGSTNTAPPALSDPVAPVAPVARPTPALDALGLTAFGAPAHRGRLAVRITDARIARPEVISPAGTRRLADDPALVFTVELTNTGAAGSIRVQPHAAAQPVPAATLEDDFGNLLRSPALPAGTRLAAGLLEDAELAPGEPRTHELAFEIPPPISDHVVLTLDLAHLGESGRVRFRIPRSRIGG